MNGRGLRVSPKTIAYFWKHNQNDTLMNQPFKEAL
jgi:hypothetical protein